jgi:hypothetical protein
MTKFNVHLYREMRLYFPGIEADSHEAAAEIVSRKPTGDADDIVDCEGENLAALVDVQDDEEYEHSRVIDFEAERQRQAAPKLLAALKAVAELRRKWRSQDEAETIDSIEYMDGLDSLELDDVITQANAAGIRPEPNAPKLLASLEAILPYAESEAYSLEKLKDSPEAEAEAERAWKAVEVAQAIVARAKAAGIVPAPADLDIDAYLAKRRQIAVLWSIENVKGVRPHLSDEQAWDVLQQVKDIHDAEWGICRTTLETVADDLFPKPKAEEA